MCVREAGGCSDGNNNGLKGVQDGVEGGPLREDSVGTTVGYEGLKREGAVSRREGDEGLKREGVCPAEVHKTDTKGDMDHEAGSSSERGHG